MFSTSYIELDSKSYEKNIQFIKKYSGNNTEVCAVIKANAYGHGSRQIVKMAKKNEIKSFAVFNANEALDVLPEITDQERLMIMGDIDEHQISWAIEHGIEMFVHSYDFLKKISDSTKKNNLKAKIHLEFETGMNRLGIDEVETDAVYNELKNNPLHLNVKALCTHFSGAESISNFERVKKQIKHFEKIYKDYFKKMNQQVSLHAACSAALVRFPKTKFNMVRIGILQYGLWPSQETRIDYAVRKKTDLNPLSSVLSWKSRVMALKHVKRGQFVGYGTSYLASHAKIIAIVPVGYANGFSRSLSNQGVVLIRGQRAPVTGMVNMNAVSVDVTQIEGIKVGDQVTLIGKDGEKEISIRSFSDYSSQLNYELLTRLPQNIPKKIIV